MLLALAGFCAGAQAPGLKTVCIDAGHGGKDSGCISRDALKTKEKDITLGIALKLRDLIKEQHPDVTVVMTRDSDSYPALDQRAKTANKAGADLFISIHVNSLDPKKNKNYASVSGFSIHTLGQSRTGRDLFSSNMELCKRENSVILLEEDYNTKYQGFEPGNPESYIIFNLMQNTNLQQSLAFAEDLDASLRKGPVGKSRGISQDPFLVLWMTTMPSVLIECGFMTNATDLAARRTADGQSKIAGRIAEAFTTFKTRYDKSLSIGEEPGKEEAASSDPDPAPGGPLYGTQIMASSKKLSENDKAFKGYKPTIVYNGKLYKYVIGTSSSMQKAKEEYAKIKKLYPDSFFVEVGEDWTKTVK